MWVLLDECLPRRLKRELVGHDVITVPEAGWSSKKKDEVLSLASGSYDAFITIESNLAYQQRVVGLSFGVLVLRARSNRLADLQPLVPAILNALAGLKPGEIVAVGGQQPHQPDGSARRRSEVRVEG